MQGTHILQCSDEGQATREGQQHTNKARKMATRQEVRIQQKGKLWGHSNKARCRDTPTGMGQRQINYAGDRDITKYCAIT